MNILNIKTGFSILFVAFQLTFAVQTVAQLSPGDLAEAHANLEGISKCTECHTLGEKISNDKCLKCHDVINSLIQNERGYHASNDVRNQECTACHSDHHGREFDMVRFDLEAFDHNLTGFELTGAHTNLECKDCHKSDYINDPILRKKEETFLGMGNECLSCHVDFHQNTLSTDCISCHTTKAFRPADLFDHALTDFPLKGQHQSLDCTVCHETTTRNGREFQEFSGLSFQNCAACHEDPHNNRFGINCAQCHTEESFQAIAGRPSFDHNTTDFPLRGQHQRIDCASCHDPGAGAQNIFKDFNHLQAINCTNCHDDVHENRFGTDCQSCHNENSFQDITGIVEFDHSLTSFPLEGMHTEIDCYSCHGTKMTDPLPHNQCTDCHIDFHEGQLADVDGIVIDCGECHSVAGFAGSSYSIEQHNTGPFPLLGAHLATPCFACHLKDENWMFDQIGQNCNDCHEDIHQGNLSNEYYPDKNCTYCHNVNSWTGIDFNHALTGYEIQGAHLKISCVACHLDEDKFSSMEGQPFSGLNNECQTCHTDIHHGQFDVESNTQCDRCHDEERWKPSHFDHNSARFSLEGAHVQVACIECHKESSIDEVTYTLYRIENFECASCHQ